MAGRKNKVLTGMGMRMGAWALAAAGALVPQAAQAFGLPKPADAQQQAWVQRFAADLERVTRDTGYFTPPASPMAWPCEITQRALYMAAGLIMALPEEARKVQALTRKTMREAGLDPDSAGKGEEYTFIRVTPLRAACKDGKIDGEVELLSEYETKMESSHSMSMGQKLVTNRTRNTTQGVRRIVLRFKDGESVGQEYAVARSRTRSVTESDDPQMQAAMARSANSGPDEPTLIYNYMTPDSDKMAMFVISMVPRAVFVTMTWDKQLMTTFSEGMRSGEMRSVSYKNEALSGKTRGPRMREGKMHGEQVMQMENYLKATGMRLDQMPGMEQARMVMVDGVEMIETRNCYSDGVMIKTATCPAD